MNSWDTSARSVDSWLERVGSKVSVKALLRLFDQAMDALWKRANPVLGEVTIAAIVDRVLWNSAEHYAFLSPLKLGSAGISSAGLKERASTLDVPHLKEGLRFTLVEFLTVIGALTGDILTPPLQEELLKLPKPGRESAPPGKDSRQP